MSISTLADVTTASLKNLLANEAFNSGAWAAGTTAGTIKSTVALNFKVNGVFKTYAITDNVATALTASMAVQAANTTAYYLIYITSAGAVGAVQSVVGSTRLLTESVPDNATVVAVLKMVTTTGFTPGTTALAAAGCTATWANVNLLPSAVATDLTYA